MKKSILFITVGLLIFSCEQKNTNMPTVIRERKLEIFCDSFLLTHNNWKQNDITNEKANTDLKTDLSTQISHGLFSDFPLRLKLINEYQPGKYAAHFSTEDTVKTKYDFNFDVIALIPKMEGEKLKTDSLYGLSGEFKNFLYGDFKDYTYDVAYSPEIRILTDNLYEDSAAFDLGIILIDKPVVKRIN
jgi:hypothetical protein